MTTAVADPAEFLDIDVHQVAGGGMLIAPDHPAGWPVQPVQPGHLVPRQHFVHRRRMQPEVKPDPGRPPPTQIAQLDDPPLDPARGAPR